jgi:predicted ATPase
VPDVSMVDTVLGYVRRKRLLLVLDNCEHLIETTAQLADRLLTACPDLHILATSREPLQIVGERRWRVQPLATPDAGGTTSFDALARIASVRLFQERAQAIDAEFRLTEANAAAVGQICARLDGIPLAIELAACRTGMLAVEQIAERLDDCFQVLAGGRRAGPTRQQTMEAALRWSYDLLTPSEQATFRILSTFAGGFDLEAAEAIVGYGDWLMRGNERRPPPPISHHLSPNILDVLGSLVEKSLVVGEQVTRSRRCRLLEPVRQYAHRLLATGGEEQDVRSHHAAYYTGLAERAAPMPRGPEQIAWLDRFEAEKDNLRAALGWTTEHGSVDEGLRLAVAMAPYWEARGYLDEGRHWLEIVLAASRTGGASCAVRMQALLAAGTLALSQRDLAPADSMLSEALEAARALANRRSEAEALARLASVQRHLDAVERALMLSDESVSLGRQLDDDATLALALLHQGMAFGAQALLSGARGDAERAIVVLEECLMLYRRLGDVRQIATAATVLGRTSRLTGDHARSAALLREAVVTLSAIGDQANLVDALGGLAHAAMAQGKSKQAARWLAAGRALRHALGMRYSAPNNAYDLNIREALQRQMSASEFDEAYAAGAAMSLDQVLAELAGPS